MSVDCGTVLVVDDSPANRELLSDLLSVQGYRVLEASNGEQALKQARESLPDVILLDVMMPAPDGFEVCRILKNDKTFTHIPIILVTALTDRASRLRGIGEGANDFLTKPLDTNDTVLRVRNAVRSKKLYDLSEERLRKQVELEKVKESLIHMIVHDLRTPLSAMIGYNRLLARTAAEKLEEREMNFLARSIANGDRMDDMISSVLDVFKMESGQLEPNIEAVDVNELLTDLKETLDPLTRDGVKITVDGGSCICNCDQDLIRRVLMNLVNNSLRHLSTEGGLVDIQVTQNQERWKFSVKDNGRGIAPEIVDNIFDMFSQAEKSSSNWGLGLTFCKMALAAHGGDISVQSELGAGSTFSFYVPCIISPVG